MAHEVERTRGNRSADEEDRSLGDLFSELTRETTTLMRQEVALAKAEMSQRATRVGKDVGYLVAGGAVAYAGFLAIIAAIVLALIQLGMTWWLSALIVGVVVAAIGGFLVRNGMNNLKHKDLAPTETLTTLKEDTQWAKEQTK